MKRTLVIPALLLLAASAAAQTTPAQTTPAQTKNPVSTALRDILRGRQKNTVAAVETMPADKFNYKSTAGQMTFGHLIVHMAETNNLLCGKAAAVPAARSRRSRIQTRKTSSWPRSRPHSAYERSKKGEIVHPRTLDDNSQRVRRIGFVRTLTLDKFLSIYTFSLCAARRGRARADFRLCVSFTDRRSPRCGGRCSRTWQHAAQRSACP